MRLALILSLVSSIQIFQQSALEKSDFSSIFEFSLASAAFPIGKFIATCILSIDFGGAGNHVDLHAKLDQCAKLLIFGAFVMICPIFPFLSTLLGRFLIGFSAGNGFICAPAVLHLSIPENLRPPNFLFLAAAFSFGTFLASLLDFLQLSKYVAAGFTVLSGILYLILRPAKFDQIFGPDSEDSVAGRKSEHPILFIVILMILNVSIGVPIIQTYSTLIFEYFQISETRAKILSLIYPILQFIPIFVSTEMLSFSRKSLILGGYYLALMAQFFIMITSEYTLMPDEHRELAMCILVMILACAFTVPCNTGLCMIFVEVENQISTTTTTTEHPTFTVDVLDAPIERIEIRLMDENITNSNQNLESSTTSTTTSSPSQEDQHPESPPPTDPVTEVPLYKKAEYVVQTQSTPGPTPLEYSYSYLPTEYSAEVMRTSEPIVVGEQEGYFSTVPSNHEIQAKAWISHAPPVVPQFDGDIDEDDLPPQPEQQTNSDEADEPEEECLANKEHLSPEVISRLQEETANLYKLVRKRNELQKLHCQPNENQVPDREMDQNCITWRSEKLVYYYKLMRKTYCRVDQWPNPSKVKKTYGEYLNLFGTFYAFQK
ncbi:unnamed protein product [Caenorhabditis angaria]|uniref:Uncharacterized protein n=1 Tax=Caenorhabditis angaria TaxID=860376 RepID=A0A9P1IZL3_9PELO|nr:unnamed protein product [Caenorhabditis angaria]